MIDVKVLKRDKLADIVGAPKLSIIRTDLLTFEKIKRNIYKDYELSTKTELDKETAKSTL